MDEAPFHVVGLREAGPRLGVRQISPTRNPRRQTRLVWPPRRANVARTGAVIITKNEDFAQMTVLRPEPVAVVWLRLGD